MFGKGIGKSYALTKQTMWQMSKYALSSAEETKEKTEENAPGVPPELPMDGYNQPLNTRSTTYD